MPWPSRISALPSRASASGLAILGADRDCVRAIWPRNSVAAERLAGRPAAYSCGVPATQPEGARGQQPIFHRISIRCSCRWSRCSARETICPIRISPGVDCGQLPAGRKWGSTASVTTAPDGTIWVIDRCGNSGAGGTTCGGASASVNPIFQFDPSGKLLKTFGAGMFVSPHKLTVDEDGNLWVADNGSHQVFKLIRTARC